MKQSQVLYRILCVFDRRLRAAATILEEDLPGDNLASGNVGKVRERMTFQGTICAIRSRQFKYSSQVLSTFSHM